MGEMEVLQQETPKILSPDPRKSRALVPADDPRQSTPRREIESPTRPGLATDRATDAPTEGRHVYPIRGFSGCSSSPAQLKSGPAPAAAVG